jgi:hypothetical protein
MVPLAALMSLLPSCIACPFGGGMLEDLPPGHPAVGAHGRRLLPADLAIQDPSADDGSKWTDLWKHSDGSTTGNADSAQSASFTRLVQLSQQHNDAEICYWSYQTLPAPSMSSSPPTVLDEEIDMWFTAPSKVNFMDHALSKIQAMVTDGGPVVWATGSAGKIFRNKVCQINRTPTFGDATDCNKAAVTNMELQTPVAVVIFKIQASKASETWDAMVKWRSNQAEGHYHEMNSGIVHQKGWGQGGQIISKAVKCADIPDRFKYKNLFKGDLLAPGGTQTWADHSFETWKSLCNLRNPSKCPSTTPTGGAMVSSNSRVVSVLSAYLLATLAIMLG